MIPVCLGVKPRSILKITSGSAYSRHGFCMQNKSEFPWLIYVSFLKGILVLLDQILANFYLL